MGGHEYIILSGGNRFDIPEEDKEEWIRFFDEADRATEEINRAPKLPNSTHRDGSIYSAVEGWHQDYRISETTETQLEPMIFSSMTRYCYPDEKSCRRHIPRPMMQIFSLKLATLSAHNNGPVQIYGYLATRDTRDALRNYIFNRSRDNSLMLEPGSLIEMTGPKRGIGMRGDLLIEYEMWIKKEEQEDDLQLIDGVSDYDKVTLSSCHPFLNRIDGVGGAVDITLSMFYNAVEATIQVDTTHVSGSGFHLLLLLLVGLKKKSSFFMATSDSYLEGLWFQQLWIHGCI